MTVTLLTLAILLIVGSVVFKGVIKGREKGFTGSIINLVSILFSIIVGSLLSTFVYAKKLGERLISEFNLYELIEDFTSAIGGNFESLVLATVSMVLSALVFLIVYLITLAICRLAIAIVYATVLKTDKNDLDYQHESETWFRRNKDIHWLDADNAFNKAVKIINEGIDKNENSN